MAEDETFKAEVPQSNLYAGTVSPKKFETWLKPRDALARLPSTDFNASALVMEHLCSGLIAAAAHRATLELDEALGALESVDLFLIPPHYWEYRTTEQFLWSAGFVSFKVSGTWNNLLLRTCTDVRFDRISVDHLSQQLPQRELPKRPPDLSGLVDTQPTPSVGRGGRPRKSFWDALWADVCAQMYLGDLKPKTQADIERAMLDWAVTHGEDLAEQTARERARLLWAAISKDEN